MSRATRRGYVRKRPAYTESGMPKTERDERALADLRATVGRRIDQMRRDRSKEVKDLAAEMGWHKSEYSRKHRGQTPVKDEEVIMLRRILGAPSVGWPYISVEEALVVRALGHRAAEVVEHLQEIVELLDARKRR